MNPLSIMKLKPLLERFKENHPKVPMFFAAAAQTIGENSVIEIKVTTAEGKDIITNMRVTADDLELFSELKGLMQK